MISWQHKHAEDISNTCKPAANNVRRERRHPMVRIALYCTLNKDGVIAYHSRYSKTSNNHSLFLATEVEILGKDKTSGPEFVSPREICKWPVLKPRFLSSPSFPLVFYLLRFRKLRTNHKPNPHTHGEPPERLRDRRASGGMTSKRWPCHGHISW